MRRIGIDTGGILTLLDADEIARVRRQLAELAPEAVAVCLLHAYANPEHEERLAAAPACPGPGWCGCPRDRSPCRSTTGQNSNRGQSSPGRLWSWRTMPLS